MAPAQDRTGGWAAKRFEATVEESWECSAERVAMLVDDVVRRPDPAVVAAAGDERAITLPREHLLGAVHERFVGIPGGGRHADGSDGDVSRRVAEAVAESAAYDEAELLGRFAQVAAKAPLMASTRPCAPCNRHKSKPCW
jgi:hypothetical protein